MTNFVESIEREYKFQLGKTPTRKKGMFIAGNAGTVGYGIASALPKMFPEYFPGAENIDAVEYVKSAVMVYPLFLGACVGIGALMPELYQLSLGIAVKPIKFVGKGIDHISNRFR